MTNLRKCTGCGKEFSWNAPKCPNCGTKYHICALCTVPIVPNEKIIFITEEHIFGGLNHVVAQGGTEIELFNEFGEKIKDAEKCIHFSCLEPHFLSPEFVKCPDCGQCINCPKFSLEDLLFKSYSDIQGKITRLSEEDRSKNYVNRREKITRLSEEDISKNYANRREKITIDCSNCGNPDVLEIEKDRICPRCLFPIIPAIHNSSSEYYYTGEHEYENRKIHSFCTSEAIAWKSKRKGKKRGFFYKFFVDASPDPGKKKEI